MIHNTREGEVDAEDGEIMTHYSNTNVHDLTLIQDKKVEDDDACAVCELPQFAENLVCAENDLMVCYDCIYDHWYDSQ